MLRVGLTGGIGSGKSTIGRIFESLGVPVLYADIVGKDLMNTNPELIAAIKQHFGEEAYTDNRLNRSYLAGIVFKEKEKLELLNSLVHPATINYSTQWMQRQVAHYVIKEAALLFESGSQANLDYVIGVSAPQYLRIYRAIHRDGLTREQVLDRMDKQLDESMKLKLCDFVVVNDDQHPVLEQVLQLHEQLCTLAEAKVHSHL
jgi:dephospho-CoA kinase